MWWNNVQKVFELWKKAGILQDLKQNMLFVLVEREPQQ